MVTIGHALSVTVVEAEMRVGLSVMFPLDVVVIDVVVVAGGMLEVVELGPPCGGGGT
jgi:hypothetical protein